MISLKEVRHEDQSKNRPDGEFRQCESNGKLYLKPEFSEYDPEKAVEYLGQAAAKDNAFARYQLGKLFCQGKLVQKDIARGLPLLEELAEAGVASAAYIVGKVYLNEEGWKDVQKAIRCFHMAADDGNSYAEYQLGKIYYFGNGIRADPGEGAGILGAICCPWQYVCGKSAAGDPTAAHKGCSLSDRPAWADISGEGTAG